MIRPLLSPFAAASDGRGRTCDPFQTLKNGGRGFKAPLNPMSLCSFDHSKQPEQMPPQPRFPVAHQHSLLRPSTA